MKISIVAVASQCFDFIICWNSSNYENAKDCFLSPWRFPCWSLFTIFKRMPVLAGKQFKHEHDPGTEAIGEVGVTVHLLRFTHQVHQLVKPHLVCVVQLAGYVLNFFTLLMAHGSIVGIARHNRFVWIKFAIIYLLQQGLSIFYHQKSFPQPCKAGTLVVDYYP